MIPQIFINDLGSLIVFIIGVIIALIISRYFQCSFPRSIIIYLWHSLFCFAYVWYSLDHAADSNYYYISSFNSHIKFSFGIPAVLLLTSIFSKTLGLSYLATSLVYSIFGFIGLIAFDSALRSVVNPKDIKTRNIATIIIFIPSLSFWSSGLGKDSLALLSIGLLLWAAIQYRRRIWLFAPAVLIMMIIRPHIAVIMIISMAISIVIQKQLPIILRAVISIIILISSIIIIPIGAKYIGLESISESKPILNYINLQSKINMEGGSSINITAMPLPMKIGTYLFRPFFFDAKSIYFMISSIDNAFLLYLFIIGVNKMTKIRYYFFYQNRAFIWSYALITLLVLSMTTANLGISVRQKWMVMPMFIFLIISVLGKNKHPKVISPKKYLF